MQRALEQYPREAVAAMAGLWDLGPGLDLSLRLPANRSSLRLVRGGGYVHEWVWGSLAPASQSSSSSSSPAAPQSGWRSLFRPRQQVMPCGKTPSAATDLLMTPTSDTSAPGIMSSGGDAPEAVDEGLVPMAALVVCIPGVCGMGPSSFLATCVRATERLGDAGLFEKPALQVAVALAGLPPPPCCRDIDAEAYPAPCLVCV